MALCCLLVICCEDGVMPARHCLGRLLHLQQERSLEAKALAGLDLTDEVLAPLCAPCSLG
jgi:hypothetical protein